MHFLSQSGARYLGEFRWGSVWEVMGYVGVPLFASILCIVLCNKFVVNSVGSVESFCLFCFWSIVYIDYTPPHI